MEPDFEIVSAVEKIADGQMIETGDGMNDGQPQTGGVFLFFPALVEAFEDALFV